MNYKLKKNEAERIDRENQKIMHRIMHIKPSLIPTGKLNKEHYRNHIQRKRMVSITNDQGVSLEKMHDIKRSFSNARSRFQDKGYRTTSTFPSI